MLLCSCVVVNKLALKYETAAVENAGSGNLIHVRV